MVVIALASHLCQAQVRGHEWVKLVVGSLLCLRGFSPGSWVFPSPQKSKISKFQFDWMQDLPENNFWGSGAS